MQTYLEPGRVLAGKYRVERVLGEGAMGVVLLAHHIHLDELVAIKVPLPEALSSPDAVARFLREARAAVKIKSEYVARVSDVGTLETGEPFIVMEYLEGRDLSAWLTEHGRLPVEQAVEFVLQACEALAEAHSHGIVHRDLKPANLFCTRRADGLLAVKVLDFGISKLADGSVSDASMTKVGAVMGSPLYMSPEQLVSSRDVDARSDVWAIGVILYELIAAESPFIGETLIGISMQIAQAPPRPLRVFRPDVPVTLETVILRCLEKNRNHRYANVAELAQALQPFASKRAHASIERVLRVIATSSRTGGAQYAETALPPSSDLSPSSDMPGKSGSTPGQTLGAFGQTARSGQRRAGPLVGLGVGVVTLGAAAFVWFESDRAARAPESTVATATASMDTLPTPPVTAEPAPAKPTESELMHRPPTTPAKDTGIAPVPVVESEPVRSAPVVEENPTLAHAASARARPKPIANTKKQSAAPEPASKKSSCSPNYYFDTEGEKHFKPECF